jgi:signal transduction histidine kinase
MKNVCWYLISIYIIYYNSSNKQKRGSYCYLTVQDTGTGISHEILPKLFTKFVTKSESGTDLGLFISKNIIEDHGGRLWQKLIMEAMKQLLLSLYQ